ncbi:helix-turn-helix domain-containing protein [Vagococcus intermedius]|uniref:Helix-turn-helix domain-containing protein n=1 Tax=Vagococcus intermedius TaxID=2991418 RepID=A0AAF0CUB9_9ENTE|nr:helix-turn-helix domain-containing protein [Vagococcus intermedius]WEG72877.1 helix-turn-helix domain-containing protein [Vagococcus intermedius]WEG74964.1 helix-turn-helix domain-containing protein [Vagococcus intermedius]
MRELLDASTRRRLAILEQLNITSNWVSSNELAEQNQASLRTINSDVHFLKEQWAPFLIIETSKKNGVRLKTPASSHVSVVYNKVIQKSDSFRLLESIFFNPNLVIEDWEEQLFISESSLYRISNQLSKSLANFGLKLQKRPCHITPHNEYYVRHFFTIYLFEIYGVHHWPFKFDRKLLVNFSTALYKKFGYYVDELLIMFLAYIIAVTLERYSQGFKSDSKDYSSITADQKEFFLQHKEMLNLILAPHNLNLDDDLTNELIVSILFLKAELLDDIKLASLDTKIEQFLSQLQQRINEKLDMESYQQITSMLRLIYFEHYFYPFNDYILFDRYQFNGKAIEKNYPIFTDLIKECLLPLENNMGFPWSSQFNSKIIYWLMVKWKNLPLILENKKAKARLLIISDLGNEHAELLADMITKNFNSKVEITIYYGSIIFLENNDPNELNNYDYYITTFFWELLNNDKVIVVDAIPSDQDWGEIRQAINTVYRSHLAKLP